MYTPTEHFDRMRQRWSQKTIRDVALMTYLSAAKDDADADAQLREAGRSSMYHMLHTTVMGPQDPLLRPDMTVFEIGCGGGRVATELVDYLTAGSYYGFDLSPSFIEVCKKRAPKGSFLTTDGYGFPRSIQDGSADLVIEFAIFCHMPLQLIWRWLNEVHRVLKHGGRTYLQFHNLASEGKWGEFTRSAATWNFLYDAGHPRAVLWETVQLLFRRADLPIQHVIEMDHDAKGNPNCWFVIAEKL